MSADKHKSLSRRVAWLRHFTFTDENGRLQPFRRRVNMEGYPHITSDLLRLEKEGMVRRTRDLSHWGQPHKRVTCFQATPAGIEALAGALTRYGLKFGQHFTQSDRPNKTERRRRAIPPEVARRSAREKAERLKSIREKFRNHTM